MTEAQILKLWSLFVDDKISPDEDQQLVAALEADPNTAASLLQDLSMEGALHQLAVTDEDFMSGFMERLHAEEDGGAIVESVRERIVQEEGYEEDEILPVEQVRPRRTRRFPLFAKLAAAAVVLACIGVSFFYFRQPVQPLVVVAKQVGQVAAHERMFSTAEGSYCKLAFADGGILALDEKAKVRVDPVDGGKTVTHNAGRMYLDIPTQEKPFVIDSGPTKVEVLGTRLLLANRGARQEVSVLHGATRVSHGPASTRLRTGQTAFAETTRRGNSLVRVFTLPVNPAASSWLSYLDIDGSRVLADMQQETRKYAGKDIDLDQYLINGGDWSIERKDGEFLVRQADPVGEGTILFGKAKWQRGELLCQFRVLGTPKPDATVQIGFFYSNFATETFGCGDRLPGLVAFKTWVNMRLKFEIGRKNNMIVHEMEFWPEGHPEAKWAADRKWIKTPQGSSIKKRDVCGIGLVTEGCATEFRKLQLINAVEADLDALKPRRVSKDLLALYMFNEGKGALVRDLSGVGQALDLRIGSPDQAQWLPHRLNVKGAADIGYSGNMKKLCDAWAKNNALTFEIWSRSSQHGMVSPASGRRFFCLSTADRPGFWISSPHLGGKLSHGACVLADIKGKLVAAQYLSGRFAGIITTGRDALALHRRKKPIEIRMAAAENFVAMDQSTWTGDIVMVAVYGRALSREEIAQNFKAGVPLEHGFFPKMARHYETKGYVLETTHFKEGEVLASYTPAQLKDMLEKGAATVKLASAEKGRDTVDVLNITHDGVTFQKLLLPLPLPLPRSFAVECEWRIRKNLGGAGFGFNTQAFQDYRPRPVPKTVKLETGRQRLWRVGPWSRHRQEFLLVGRLHDRTPIYEVRESWGSDTGSTRWVTLKSDDLVLSVKGARVQVQAVNIVELMPAPETRTIATKP